MLLEVLLGCYNQNVCHKSCKDVSTYACISILLQYHCCLKYTDADRTPHLLTHVIGGTVDTLRERLALFISCNMLWIDEVCGPALASRNIKLDLYMNEVIEEGFYFDEVAITLVCMMSGKHALILCGGTYWSNKPMNDYEDCEIQLAFFGQNIFKEMTPKTPGATSFLGKATGFFPQENPPTPAVKHLNEHVDLDEPVGYADHAVNNDVHTNGATNPIGPATHDSDVEMKLDLIDTGLILDNSVNHTQQDQEDLQENAQADNQVDPPGTDECASDQEDVEEITKDADLTKGSNNGNLNIEKNKKLVVLLKQYSEDAPTDKHDTKGTDDASANSEQEGHEDSNTSSDSGVESDGWEPEVKRKCDALKRKRNTEVIETPIGKLSYEQHGVKKQVPRQRRHTCHLYDKLFDMQCNFTKHHKIEHPDDPYKCEHCEKMLETPNGLFKHQRSHNYLKHGCDICHKQFQFPKQKKIHECIHMKEGLYRCLHCDQHFTLNSTMLVHATTHNTSIQCELCPKTSDKRYNSTYALALHTRGMHGLGWTTTVA